MTEQALHRNDDSWAAVKDLVADALDRPAAQRGAFLDEACAGNAALRRRIERLLAVHDSAESFFDHTLTVDLPASMSAPVAAPQPEPERVGQYRILHRIASGGAGTVYEAVQDRPHRTIALKLLRAGVDSPELARRFERESEVLASLHHPAIAHVYEAGVHGEGVWQMPYIAMELVREARTIIAWAEAKRLTIEQRLELVIIVCQAVQHAHERGFVHRDLKPPNILVDSAGHAKVIDFGVARIMESEGDREHTLRTSAGDIVGTLPYMAPEQCGGDPEQVDRQADVYALGVVLFELLAGRLPLTLAGMRIEQAIEAIRLHAPARLIRVAPQVGRDLDAITARALEKDSQRRYQSAAALAADLRRHLEHRPVVSRPPHFTYQARLFARRHGVAVAAAALAGLALVAATMVSLTFAFNANRAHTAELAQRTIAERVNAHLEDMLQLPDPHASGEEVTVIEMLDRMAERLNTATDEPPEVEAPVRVSIGATYLAMNRLDAAEVQFQRARELFLLFDPQHPRLAQSLNHLGMIGLITGDDAAAEKHLRAAIDMCRENATPAHPSLTSLLGNLAAVLMKQNKLDEAEPLLREEIKLRIREFGPSHIIVVAGLRQLGRLRMQLGDLDEANELLRQSLSAAEEGLSADHPIVAAICGDLGEVAMAQGDDQQAIESFAEQWSRVKAARTVGSPDWLYSCRNFIDCLVKTGESTQADAVLSDAIELLRSELGDEDRRTREMTELLNTIRGH